jgi:hypothetical protein
MEPVSRMLKEYLGLREGVVESSKELCNEELDKCGHNTTH